MEPTFFIVDPHTKNLVSPYELLGPNNGIPKASPFSVSLVRVVVNEDYESWFGGGNDVLVMSKSAIGKDPLVDRVHFYEEEIPVGKPIKNILTDNMYLTDDYDPEKDDKLWLELWVLDVDTDDGERKQAIKGLSALAATAGAVFPVAAPYRTAAGLVLPLIEKLWSALEKDDEILKMTMAFYPVPDIGMAPLQTGTFVVFALPVDATQYKITQSGEITKGGKAVDVSYAVFNISKKAKVQRDFVINQKMATLLTQIKTGNDDTVQNSIGFIQDTLTTYSNFRKLERYATLKQITNKTQEEQALMKEIEAIQELKPFL